MSQRYARFFSSSPCWLTIDAGAQAEEAVEPAHPLGVARGEVVVDRDDVHALALERVQVARASVATSVLPSPVFISAIMPLCRTMPPISCTS